MLKKLLKLCKAPFVVFRKQNFWIQLIIVLLVLSLLKSFISGGIIEGLVNPDDQVLTYFHMSTCPHCHKFNPIWEGFVKGGAGGMKTKKVEQAEMTNEHKKLGVNGFPSVMLLNGGKKVEEFKGPRTKKDLTDFVKKHKKRRNKKKK